MKRLTIALAGNANVGKSCVFNQLTGLNQTIGNWPGKTVEKAEGTLYFQGYRIKVIDLPGTYSLSAYSAEEVVARDFIASREADVVIDIVDASALERNLYLTLQLVELETPLVVALNQVDMAEKKGIVIDHEKLSEILGVPVVPTVAVTGVGLKELLQAVVDVAEGKRPGKPKRILYGREIEERLRALEREVEGLNLPRKYPSRWLSIKLLELDPLVVDLVSRVEGGRRVVELAEEIARELEDMHGEPIGVIMAAERYSKITRMVSEVQRIIAPPRVKWERYLESLTTHPVLGYIILAAVLAGMLSFVFYVGGLASASIEEGTAPLLELAEELLKQALPQEVASVVVNGALVGLVAGLTVVLPYIIPFHIILSLLEDSGYLPRAAYLTDNLMHKVGLHGKALIPILLGFGCNVPACVGCRILETDRERCLCGFATVLIPCAARTIVILGVVGRFIGIAAALSIYLVDFAVMLLITRLAYKALPGEPVGLIMEIPPYRRPSLRSLLSKTWVRTREFIVIAFPIIIVASTFLEALNSFNLVEPVISVMEPFTSGLLGLPAQAIVPLLFGFLRKELAVVMLADALGTTDFSQVMSMGQMYTFALVVTLYIPCVATLAALVKEFGWRRAITIALLTIAVASALGGLLHLAFYLVGV